MILAYRQHLVRHRFAFFGSLLRLFNVPVGNKNSAEDVWQHNREINNLLNRQSSPKENQRAVNALMSQMPHDAVHTDLCFFHERTT
jgi:hypothetical protein